MEFSDVVLGECGESAHGSQGNLHTLWRMLRLMKAGFFKYVTAIILMSITLSAFDTATALFLKNVIARAERFGHGNLFEGLWKDLFFCTVTALIMLVLYAFSFYVYMMEAKKGTANLQKMIYGKSLRLPYAYYENTHSGEFMSRIIYDCDRATGIYGSRFRRILMPALRAVFYLIPMFALSPELTLCLFGVSAALFVINGLFIAPMQRMSRKMSGTSSSATEQLSNILSGIEQIKIFRLKSLMVDRFVSDAEKFRKEQGKINVMSAWLDGLNQCFELLGSLVFIALGIFFVSIGLTTVGNLAAVYVLYGSMSANLLQVGLYIPSMASYLANAERVFEFLDGPEEEDCYLEICAADDGGRERESSAPVDGVMTQAQEESDGEYAVCMRDVTFSYDDRREVLKNFDLSIKKGSCAAIKGESGRGKSTIAKLLLGFYPIDAGRILINNKDFHSYHMKEIRNLIAYVPQESYLYNVSIEENIRYGNRNAGRAAIVQAAKMANAHEFICSLEEGYQTKAGERGNRLSGGQRQRIAIARAILKDAPILILDEATSALDNKSEQSVNEALERLMKGKTTIVIAHRQSTLEHADEVIEI